MKDTENMKWESEFDSTWKNTEGITVLDMPLKDFIRKVESSAFQRGKDAAVDYIRDRAMTQIDVPTGSQVWLLNNKLLEETRNLPEGE